MKQIIRYIKEEEGMGNIQEIKEYFHNHVHSPGYRIALNTESNSLEIKLNNELYVINPNQFIIMDGENINIVDKHPFDDIEGRGIFCESWETLL